jgi:hypothetical protein
VSASANSSTSGEEKERGDVNMLPGTSTHEVHTTSLSAATAAAEDGRALSTMAASVLNESHASKPGSPAWAVASGMTTIVRRSAGSDEYQAAKLRLLGLGQ